MRAGLKCVEDKAKGWIWFSLCSRQQAEWRFLVKQNNAPFPLTSSSFYKLYICHSHEISTQPYGLDHENLMFPEYISAGDPSLWSTAQFRPEQPRTVAYAKYNPIRPCTAQCSHMQPSQTKHSPVQPNKAIQYNLVQLRTAHKSRVQLRTSQ